MFLEKIKQYFDKQKNNKEGNNKKTIENLTFFAIVLIVTIVIINYIWNKDNPKNKTNFISNSQVLAESKNEIEETKFTNINNLEQNLETILSTIKGVGKVKVLITYNQTSESIPMYNEDSSSTTTEETDTNGGTRRISEDEVKKDIIYQEENGYKTPVLKSKISPVIEGAVISAEGANDIEIKANIIEAVEVATGLASHKIKVFESIN